mgnify:CR=1 FL=1
MYASEAAMEVVNEALQMFGGYGYAKTFPIEKLFRDTRLFGIYEGTSEIQRLILSGYALNTYQPVMYSLEDVPVTRDTDPETLNTQNEKIWRCGMCGYIHKGETAPENCPLCFFPKSVFRENSCPLI